MTTTQWMCILGLIVWLLFIGVLAGLSAAAIFSNILFFCLGVGIVTLYTWWSTRRPK